MFKNWKIGTKLFWAFMLIAIIASSSGVTSIFLIRQMSSDADMALEKYGFATGDIGHAIIMLTDSRRLVRDVVNFDNTKDAAAAADELKVVKEKYFEYLEDVKKTIIEKDGDVFINDISKKGDYYFSIVDSIVEQTMKASKTQKQALQNRMKNELDPAYDQLSTKYNNLFNGKQLAGYELTQRLLKLSANSIYSTIALIASTFVLTLFISFKISKGISNPIKKAVEAAQNLDQGNLDISLDIYSNDEVGELSQTFLNMARGLKDIIADINDLLGEMAVGNFRVVTNCPDRYIGEYKKVLDAVKEINHKLSETLTNINTSSEQVATGSNQVAIGSQALSQGATEQAASIEQLTHTIETIAMQIGENSENCQHASIITNKATSELGEGTQKMQEMMSAMAEISETSGEIEKIIKTIDDIAFQTNILALNAAVEAARAGAAGKGFAVVADEVRNLASKSAEAAKNTTDLISRAVASVENGNKIATSTAQTLNQVVYSTLEVTKVVQKISDASENQALSVMQVTEGMEQISTVVQTNSATAEESAAASEELSAQAKMLEDLVSTFILEEEQHEDLSQNNIDDMFQIDIESEIEKYN